MKILIFVFLIQANTCFQLNKTESTEKNVSNQKLEALFDHECSECAHNFNDGEIKMGRMVTVLPVIHPTYKLSLEFYVVSTSGASWNNLLHFTKETENGHGPSTVRGPGGAWIPGHGCEHRRRFKSTEHLHISMCQWCWKYSPTQRWKKSMEFLRNWSVCIQN